MSLPSFAYPGLTLGLTTTHKAGPGTYVHGEQIQASLAGTPSISTSKPATSTSTSTKSSKPKPTISVVHHKAAALSPTATTSSDIGIPSRQISPYNTLPFVGAVVLARVTRLTARQVNLAICVVDGMACSDDFAGVVRREDVRGWEVDKIKIEDSFRVGDVVRAVVISLGDQSSYYLSTARNELGVLLATSQAGNEMHPISWQHFRDSITGKDEIRKVAKPI